MAILGPNGQPIGQIRLEFDLRSVGEGVERIGKRRISAGLSDWLRSVKKKMREYAPRDTGALEQGHFARKTHILRAELGFRFTEKQKLNNMIKSPNNPDNWDFFYGLHLHQGVTPWTPRNKGVGPFWVIKAVFDTEGDLRSSIGKNLRIDRSSFDIDLGEVD